MRNLRAALSLLVLAFVGPSLGHASGEPSWSYRVLKSEHFEVIYRKEQKALAKIYILAAEQAHELLMPIFKEGPARTIIFISDDTDSSNGLATFLPYPMITVYPVLPSTLDSIDDYGNWPLEMIVHEYTHILNMYPAHGFYVPLKYIFGGVVRPNAVLPKWYLEGLAVNMESRLTDHGRLRADETQASARALVLGNHLFEETIPRINEQELMTWPYGSRPYLFGGWWWSQVQSESGASVIEIWNQNYARRLPFLLNGPMEELTKKGAADHLDSAALEIQARAEEQLKVLDASHPHKGAAISADEKGEQSVFAVSPSGEKLVYWLSRPSTGSEARVKIRTSPQQSFASVKSERLFKSSGILRVRWLDENRFVFDPLDLKRPNVTFRDISLYDFNSKRVQKLTDGLRADEPASSPKGDKIAFIQNDGGHNRLALWQMGTPQEQMKILLNGNFQQRFSGPEFLNENEIIFAVRARSGVERLYVYNLNEKRAHLWNTSLKSAQNPRLTAKGLLVSNADTHVRNIFLATSEGNGQALTNTLTHIETADYDAGRDELLFSELTAEGRRLQSIPFAQFTPAQIEPVKLDPPPQPQIAKVKISEESYQPIEYLLPHYWIPFLYIDENGGILLQGSTSNSDPAGRNNYTLLGSYDTITKKPSYGATYVNSSLPTDIGLNYGKAVTYLGGSGLTLESQSGSLNLSNTWPFNNRFWKWNLGEVWIETQSPITTYRRLGPMVGLQYSRLQSPLNTWLGTMFELSHTEFMKEGNYLGYGRSYIHTAEMIRLGENYQSLLQLRGAFSPRLPSGWATVDLGDTSLGANYLVNLTNSDFLLRGYPSGAFTGRKVLNGNLEFSRQLADLGRGWGTFPLFLRAMEVAIFADAMAVDGYAYSPSDSGRYLRDLRQFFMGTGAELRLSTTAAYHMPISFTLGGYYGLTQRFGGGFTPFFGLGLGGLNGLENKTP